jgi:hypothetical protein
MDTRVIPRQGGLKLLQWRSVSTSNGLLDDLMSNEGGMIFEGLAVVLAKIRYPELGARERKNDLGLDAATIPMGKLACGQ